MLIGELARATGASPRALRHYEAVGLIHSCRTRGNWRSYEPSAVGDVNRVREMLAAGLPTATIARLMPCLEVTRSERTNYLHEQLALEIERTERRIHAMHEELVALQALRLRESAETADVAESAPGPTGAARS